MADPGNAVTKDDDAPLVADLYPVLVMLAAMWIAEIVDTVLSGRLDRHGIRPRHFDGLWGIVFAPFLHGGFGHLIANSVPFLLLGSAIAVGSMQRFLLVTVIVGVIGGLGTWLAGSSNSVHIGASGLVFGYLTYLVARGVFARNVWYLLGGVVVFMVYGSVLWGLLPRPGISWQGHLFGALGGVVAAWALHADKSDTPSQPRKSLLDRLSPPEL